MSGARSFRRYSVRSVSAEPAAKIVRRSSASPINSYIGCLPESRLLLSKMVGTPFPRRSISVIRGESRPGNPGRNGASGKQAGQRLVATRLAIGEIVDRHRVRQGTGRIQIDTVRKHVQSNSGSMHGVIPMGDGIDDCLEYGRQVILRLIDPSHRLSGPHPLVSGDKPASLAHLAVEGPRDILRIHLIPLRIEGPGYVPAPVGHGLNIGVWQPTFRLLRSHQNTGDRGVTFVVR